MDPLELQFDGPLLFRGWDAVRGWLAGGGGEGKGQSTGVSVCPKQQKRTGVPTAAKGCTCVKKQSLAALQSTGMVSKPKCQNAIAVTGLDVLQNTHPLGNRLLTRQWSGAHRGFYLHCRQQGIFKLPIDLPNSSSLGHVEANGNERPFHY